jgi:CubicO group peptidase (beta-lactamase class C family)
LNSPAAFFETDAFLKEAVHKRLFPGAVLTVGKGGVTAVEREWGHLTYVPWSPKVTRETIYDLASLTKPLVTALCCLALTARGELALDARLGNLLRGVPSDKCGVTIRHLLSHTAGFPAYRPYYSRLIAVRAADRRQALLAMLLEEPLQYSPGGQAVYSDLGFILLGLIVESLTGLDLQGAASSLVFGPLAVDGLRFLPIRAGDPREAAQDVSAVAPTEVCPWRERIVWGEVNDRNAWIMGGASGHAGLFGTGEAVSSLLRKIMDIHAGGVRCPGFPQELMREFLRPQGLDPASTWALGFDTPSHLESTAGRYFSPRSAGHLGFTGTSFWVDLEHEVFVVFLSNRTFPRPTEEGQAAMREFRPRLHDLVRRQLLIL